MSNCTANEGTIAVYTTLVGTTLVEGTIAVGVIEAGVARGIATAVIDGTTTGAG